MWMRCLGSGRSWKTAGGPLLPSSMAKTLSRVSSGWKSGSRRLIGAVAVTGQVTAAVFFPARCAATNSVGALMSVALQYQSLPFSFGANFRLLAMP